jgi:hypothetical protein
MAEEIAAVLNSGRLLGARWSMALNLPGASTAIPEPENGHLTSSMFFDIITLS